MSIIKPDPYDSFYAAAAQMDPSLQITHVPMQRRHVEAVDAIVELAHGERDFVHTDGDWSIVAALINFWAREWPDEYQSFKESIHDIRDYKGEGYSEHRYMKHTASISPRLMKMIKAIFPMQQWDSKFTNKFIKRFPLFKVGDESKGKVTIRI